MSETHVVVDAWQDLERSLSDLEIEPSSRSAILDAAADVVAYFSLSRARDEIPGGPTGLGDRLKDRDRFDDARWERDPTYGAPLGNIASDHGPDTAETIAGRIAALATVTAETFDALGSRERQKLRELEACGSRLRDRRSDRTILLVHGMGQGGQAAADLAAAWEKHLATSYGAADLPAPEADLRLTYYADLVDQTDVSNTATYAQTLTWLIANLMGAGSPIVPVLPSALDGATTRKAGLDLLEIGAWVARELMRSRSRFTLVREGLREDPLLTIEQVSDTRPSTGRIPSKARILRRVSTLSPSLTRLVVRTLQEVHLYLRDDGFRTAVQDRAEQTLDGSDPAVVIGHSLGSVVAIDLVLKRRRTVPCLITLGSPLWMTSIVSQLQQWHSGRAPIRVGTWLNMFDDRDIVGGGHPLRKTWGDTGPEDVKIHHGDGPYFHSIGGYLSQPNIATAIHEILNA